MLEFVNDPAFDGVPLVGEGHVLLAQRTTCGRAARWVPGGDVMALAAFLGPSFPVVGDKLYQEFEGGALHPMDLSVSTVFIVPPAGEPRGVFSITANFAQVVEVAGAAEGLTPADKLEAVLAENRKLAEANYELEHTNDLLLEHINLHLPRVGEGDLPTDEELAAANAVRKAKDDVGLLGNVDGIVPKPPMSTAEALKLAEDARASLAESSVTEVSPGAPASPVADTSVAVGPPKKAKK